MTFLLLNGQAVYNLSQENRRILELLIKCCQEADKFVFDFLITATNENTAVSDYRLHRITQRDMLIEEFGSMFSLNSVQALEELFMHPIKNHELNLLTNKIKDDTITPVKLFEMHKKQPRLKLLRLLL